MGVVVQLWPCAAAVDHQDVGGQGREYCGRTTAVLGMLALPGGRAIAQEPTPTPPTITTIEYVSKELQDMRKLAPNVAFFPAPKFFKS